MSKGYLHWCPHGCGKSVFNNRKIWLCKRCKNQISTNELLKLNNLRSKQIKKRLIIIN